MIFRCTLALLFALFISITSVAAFPIYRLAAEPTIRIGLSTNARSVSITTGDISLVSTSPDEPPKTLATTKISVSPRAYRPPVIENYHFEIQDIETKEEADQIAKDAKEATDEPGTVAQELNSNQWRVTVGGIKETIEEANSYKEFLAEKGFDVEIVTDKIIVPSAEAVALSDQLKNAKTDVRSLIKSNPTGANTNTNTVKTTGSSSPSVSSTAAVDVPPPIDPNLKEIIVNGAGESAKFSTFKPIAFSSINERTSPVRVNGKAYRGKVEVFVNARGSLTVVNVVPIEEYLKGVVPRELSLPAIEAQKAQAVAARTYALANVNGFGAQGFDLLPTTQSQVYGGHSAETAMGTRAVMETRGMVATYQGKPINAMYTSTCGGRTEDVENIYPFNQPYLRGVECSLEGREHFDPFFIKTTREPATVKDENRIELVHDTAILSLSGFPILVAKFTDEWFDAPPTRAELQSWFAPISARLRPPTPAPTVVISPIASPGASPALSPTPTPVPTPTPTPLALYPADATPAAIANYLAPYLYGQTYADTLLSSSDQSYQLSFADGASIPANARANTAVLIRDGWLPLYPDATLRPTQPMSRARIIRLLNRIADKKNWLANPQSGTTKPSADGKLVLKNGKSFALKSDVYLFRQFGDAVYQVRELALMGGETVNYLTGPLGEITFLEVKPSTSITTAERDSPFTFWNKTLSPSAVQSRLSRYVRGIGTLYDVNIKKQGVSRRAIELEIIGSNGRFSLKGGKIRSALRLNEQLFVMNKRYDSNGRVASYSFTGRGWGHGIGMCQYGAFGLAKQGIKYERILKHYYTGIDLSKAYS